MKEDKARVEAALKAARRTSETSGPQYVLESLRYWDVSMSPTKRYKVAGHFVPSVKNAALPFFIKKRRITIELYKPAPSPDIEVDEHNAEQTKKLFGELLKGISSASLMEVPTMGDNDMVAFRILKPKRETGAAPGNPHQDHDWDSHSVGSVSLSTLGFGSVAEELDFDSKNIRWKERFRCRLDSLKVINQKGRSCDIQLGSDSAMVVKTINFDSNNDHQTFIKVLDQITKLREERGKRLANAYKELRLTPPRNQNAINLSPFGSTKKSPASRASPAGKSPVRPSPTASPPLAPKTVDPSPKPRKARTKKGAERVEKSVEPGYGEINKNLDAAFETTDVEEPFDGLIQILVEIVSASNLPVADILSSDPYVEVYDGSKEIHRTRVISKSLNPVWTIKTKSLFLINTTIENYFEGSNFLSFQVKDYDAFTKNDTLGTVDISKESLLNGTGERQVFNIIPPGKRELKRRKSAGSSTLALRFRSATPDDISFMQTLEEDERRNRRAVYAKDTFVYPRDHHVSLMKRNTRKGHNHNLEYRVKPFPDPDRMLETAWLTEKEIHLEAEKPSKYWIESGTGDVGRLYVEVLWCDKLPNMDFSLTGRDKTDAFACLVFEDCYVNTDVIRNVLSPRWMPWSQRAFALNIMHPSSQLMVGVFDYDSGFTDAGHDWIGRAVVNLSNLRPSTLYTKTFELHRSPRQGRAAHGSLTLRLRVEFPSQRKALLAGAMPVFSHDVSVAEKSLFRVVHHTITHGEHPGVLSLDCISSYVQELQSYLEAAFYLQEAFATVLLWRGHYPVTFRILSRRRGQIDDSAGCWGRWTRPVTLRLPLHSMGLFGWGVALSRNFNLFPAFIVFSIGWFLLASLEQASKRPSALYKPRSYLELMSVLVFNNSVGPKRIKPNENLEKVKEYDEKQAEMKRARDEILKMMQMEQQKYEAYLEAQTSSLQEDVDITTKAHGGITSLALAPFRSLLLPLQHILHDVCIGLRMTTSIVEWRDSYVAFWIVTACFIASFLLIWVPWAFIIRLNFKILVWVFLGPWMKLLDLFYFRLIEHDTEHKKEDLVEQFNERYQALAGETLARKVRKESALKMKDMKRYMFGQYLMRVPVFKEERFHDDPVPSSFAEPFDRSKFGEINIVDRKFGQLLEGEMIPRRRDAAYAVENENGAEVHSKDAFHTIPPPPPLGDNIAETEPLLMPKLDDDYGSTAKKAKKHKRRGWSPKRGA